MEKGSCRELKRVIQGPTLGWWGGEALLWSTQQHLNWAENLIGFQTKSCLPAAAGITPEEACLRHHSIHHSILPCVLVVWVSSFVLGLLSCFATFYTELFVFFLLIYRSLNIFWDTYYFIPFMRSPKLWFGFYFSKFHYENFLVYRKAERLLQSINTQICISSIRQLTFRSTCFVTYLSFYPSIYLIFDEFHSCIQCEYH